MTNRFFIGIHVPSIAPPHLGREACCSKSTKTCISGSSPTGKRIEFFNNLSLNTEIVSWTNCEAVEWQTMSQKVKRHGQTARRFSKGTARQNRLSSFVRSALYYMLIRGKASFISPRCFKYCRSSQSGICKTTRQNVKNCFSQTACPFFKCSPKPSFPSTMSENVNKQRAGWKGSKLWQIDEPNRPALSTQQQGKVTSKNSFLRRHHNTERNYPAIEEHLWLQKFRNLASRDQIFLRRRLSGKLRKAAHWPRFKIVWFL